MIIRVYLSCNIINGIILKNNAAFLHLEWGYQKDSVALICGRVTYRFFIE